MILVVRQGYALAICTTMTMFWCAIDG